MTQQFAVEGRYFPSITRPDRALFHLAIILVAGLAVAFAASMPFAGEPLPPMVAFVPAYQSALATCDLLTAVLLLGQHKLLRSPALLVLASGYVFTALVALIHMLTFPGLFTPEGLFDSGPQTTAWLYMYWHAGFPAFVVAYALVKDRPARTGPADPWLGLAASAALAIGGAACVIWLSAPARDLMPSIMQGHHYSPAMLGVVTTVWALSAIAAFVVWRRQPHSVLDLWLTVVMCAWTFDIALSAVLNHGRFDLGFYAGRIFGLVAAMMMLFAFLVEYGKLYERLSGTLETETHLRAAIQEKAGEIERLNESLELRIAQRTKELEDSLGALASEVAERHRAETATEQARQRLAGIIDSAMDAIITIDDRHDIVLFNRAAEVIFGYGAGEVLGRPLSRLLPERFREEHARDLARFGEAPSTPRRMSAQRVVSGVRRSGEEFPIDASISHATVDGRKYFTVVLRDVTERVKAEDALKRSRQELLDIATLSSAAQEHEKRRVSRELHDELGQILAAMKLDIEWLSQHVDPANPAKTARAASIRSLTNDAVTAVRRIAADLRPVMLDDLGLVAAVEWLATTFEQRHGITCTLAIEPPELDVPDPQSTAVFRIVQEALTNVARHAHASRVQIDVLQDGNELHVSIGDDGRGFDMAQPRRVDAFGILGLRERAYLVKGKVRIESAPGRGTRIEAVIPLPAG